MVSDPLQHQGDATYCLETLRYTVSYLEGIPIFKKLGCLMLVYTTFSDDMNKP